MKSLCHLQTNQDVRICFQLAILVTALYLGMTPSATGDTLSNNLSQTTDSSDPVTSTLWSAAGFSTPSSGYKLISATLLMDQYTSGIAQLALYTDNDNKPGMFVGLLTPPASYSSGLADTTFGGNRLFLSANSNYWLLLSASSGGFDWGYTDSSIGIGPGFNDWWGSSFNSGKSWETFDVIPYQMAVVAEPIAASTPEPSTLTFLLLSVVPLLAFSALNRKSPAKEVQK